MTQRLLILDHPELTWLDRARAATAPGDVWQVLVLRMNPQSFQRQCAPALAGLGTWTLVDTSALAQAAHDLVASFLVDYIARLPGQDLGGQTLAELLAEPGHNLWWYLETSEKNHLRSPLVGQLYQLALARLALTRHPGAEVWLDLHDRHLQKILAAACAPSASVTEVAAAPARHPWRSYWANALRACGVVLFQRLLIQLGRWSSPCASEAVFFFSFYPYWWIRPYRPDLVDRFFAHLPEGITAQYVAWLTDPREVWQQRRAVGAALRQRALVPLQQFVSLADALGLLSPRAFLQYWRFETRLRPHLQAQFAGFEVGELFGADLSRSLAGPERWLCQLLAQASRRFSHRVKPRAVVYRIEFQPFENALLFGLGPQTPTVGFHHASFGRYHLPLRFAPGELAEAWRHPSESRTRPLPRAILASGEAGVDHLRAQGYPAERIFTCGPQRHGDLLAFLRQRPPRPALRARLHLPADQPVLFVALATVAAETEALFATLAEACQVFGQLHLVLKPHPTRPLAGLAQDIAREVIGPDRITLVPADGNMYEYLAAADALVGISSTIAFEAMALEVMPIMFEDPATFTPNSLADYEAALYVVRTPAALRVALSDTLANTAPAQAKKQAWAQTLRYVFRDLETPLAVQLRRALLQASMLE